MPVATGNCGGGNGTGVEPSLGPDAPLSQSKVGNTLSSGVCSDTTSLARRETGRETRPPGGSRSFGHIVFLHLQKMVRIVPQFCRESTHNCHWCGNRRAE